MQVLFHLVLIGLLVSLETRHEAHDLVCVQKLVHVSVVIAASLATFDLVLFLVESDALCLESVEFPQLLVCLNQVDYSFWVTIQWWVGLEEVHDCISVRHQVIEVLISKHILLVDFVPEFAGSLFDLLEVGCLVYSESAYIGKLRPGVPGVSYGVGQDQFHTDGLDHEFNLGYSRKDRCITLYSMLKIINLNMVMLTNQGFGQSRLRWYLQISISLVLGS